MATSDRHPAARPGTNKPRTTNSTYGNDDFQDAPPLRQDDERCWRTPGSPSPATGGTAPATSSCSGGICADLGRRLRLRPWAARGLFALVLMLLPDSELIVYPVLWVLLPLLPTAVVVGGAGVLPAAGRSCPFAPVVAYAAETTAPDAA